MTIESLEARIAPASVSVTYTDVDGDLVKITATVPGGTAPLDEADLTFVGGGSSGQLAKLNLTDAGFTDAKIVITALKKADGDGRASIGFIDATGRDLDSVIISGDLGRIIVGDGVTANDGGLNLLQARSMGALGLSSQGGTGDLNSKITGRLGVLKIANDITDAWVDVVAPGNLDGQIGTVLIGGTIHGGTESNSGRVSSSGTMAMVRIGGDIVGGPGAGTGQIFSITEITKARIGGDIVGSAAIYSGQIATFGKLGKIQIAGSVIGGAGEQSGFVFASSDIDTVTIGGDIIGGAQDFAGAVFTNTVVNKVTVGGDVIGGSGGGAGSIYAAKTLHDVRVAGNVLGGNGTRAGSIYSLISLGDVRVGGDLVGKGGNISGFIGSQGSVESVQVGGNVFGGQQINTGQIFSNNTLGTVKVGGSVIGGTSSFSGSIYAAAGVTSVEIGKNIVGGDVAGTASAIDLGGIFSGGPIGSVHIGGSIIAGSDASSGTLARSGAITSIDSIGEITIGRNVVGNSTNPVIISAVGQPEKPATGTDVAIGNVTINGVVRFAQILAGFDQAGAPANADASIESVLVKGNWIASSIVAGAQDQGADGFGINDTLQSVGNTSLVARISSIIIKGEVAGSTIVNDSFGFVAQQIERLEVGGRSVSLEAGPSSAADNFLLLGTNDVHVLEV